MGCVTGYKVREAIKLILWSRLTTTTVVNAPKLPSWELLLYDKGQLTVAAVRQQHMKTRPWNGNHLSNSHFCLIKQRKLKAIPPNQGCPLSSYLFNIVTELPARAVRQSQVLIEACEHLTLFHFHMEERSELITAFIFLSLFGILFLHLRTSELSLDQEAYILPNLIIPGPSEYPRHLTQEHKHSLWLGGFTAWIWL